MREAEIKCLIQSLRVESLGLTLFQGQTIIISETAYKKATELQRFLHTGGIALKWRDPMKDKPKPKSYAPPYVKGTAKHKEGRKSRSDTFSKTSSKPAAVLGASKEETKAAVKEVLQEQMVELKKQLLAELVQNMSSPQVDMSQLGSMLQNTVKEALANVSVSGGVSHQTNKVSEDEPVFIPSDLTTAGSLQGNSVSVESVSTEDDSLDDAAQALRAMRSRKKRRKKTGENK